MSEWASRCSGVFTARASILCFLCSSIQCGVPLLLRGIVRDVSLALFILAFGTFVYGLHHLVRKKFLCGHVEDALVSVLNFRVL